MIASIFKKLLGDKQEDFEEKLDDFSSEKGVEEKKIECEDEKPVRLEEKIEDDEPYVFPPVPEVKTPERDIDAFREEGKKFLETYAYPILGTYKLKAECVDMVEILWGKKYILEVSGTVTAKNAKSIIDDISYHTGQRVDLRPVNQDKYELSCEDTKVKSILMQEVSSFPQEGGILYGINEDGESFNYGIEDIQNTLITGIAGYGKTNALLSMYLGILYSFKPDEITTFFFDIRRTSSFLFENAISPLGAIVEKEKMLSILNYLLKKPYDECAKTKKTVIFIDNLGDLLLDNQDIKNALNQILIQGRAKGIYVIATMLPRPAQLINSILINFQTKICLCTLSESESRVCLGKKGPESCLFQGEAYLSLYKNTQVARFLFPKVSEEEINGVEFYINRHAKNRKRAELEYNLRLLRQTQSYADDSYDPMLEEVGCFIIDSGKASIGLIQRRFKIGFNRAARLIDELCEVGALGPDMGTMPREILMSKEEFLRSL